MTCCILWCTVRHECTKHTSFRSAYFDLRLLAGLGAHRLDDVTVVTPDFLIVHLQATLVPAPHVDVSILLLAYVFEVHDFIPGVK